MIDEQHPMQIGMFPMAMKCQTPQQQLQQQQLQLQQQQQQQLQQQLQHPQQNELTLSGSDRLLTTATTNTSTSVAGIGATAVPAQKHANQLPQLQTLATQAQMATNVKAMTLDVYANVNNNNNNNNNSEHCNQNGLTGGGHVPCNRMQLTLADAGLRLGMGNNNAYCEQQCVASKASNNNGNSNTDKTHNQRTGPGPPPSQSPAPPPTTTAAAVTTAAAAALVASNANTLAANIATRVALAECNTLNSNNSDNCNITAASANNDTSNSSSHMLSNRNESPNTSPSTNSLHNNMQQQLTCNMPQHSILQTPHSPQHNMPPNALQQQLLANTLPLNGCGINAVQLTNNSNSNSGNSGNTESINLNHANGLQLTMPTLLQQQQQLSNQQQQRHLQQQHQTHLHQLSHHHHHHHQHNQQLPHQQQCGYCCQPICDRYIMRVVDTSFHENCLKCANCGMHLENSCYARDGKLYCRIDYERLFIRNRCLGCGHKIASDELVMRTYENVFHIKCFACVVCGAMLKKGEQYVVKQGQLFCRFDYEKEVEMLQGYDFYGDDLFPPKLDGRRGPKRPRTILNTQQRRAFKASFEMSPKPCRKVRENLAKETGLSLRIVQVWFQNQRAKVKKIQKKAKQEPTKGTSDSQDSQESDSSLAKIKDEAHSDSESLLESPFSSCGGSAGNGLSSSLDAIGKLRCIKEEQENTPFNCMETNKENCNKNNEPILNTILGLSYATFQQLMGPFTQTPMINPIDRLYSMQNSYFRPDDMGYGECSKEGVEN